MCFGGSKSVDAPSAPDLQFDEQGKPIQTPKPTNVQGKGPRQMSGIGSTAGGVGGSLAAEALAGTALGGPVGAVVLPAAMALLGGLLGSHRDKPQLQIPDKPNLKLSGSNTQFPTTAATQMPSADKGPGVGNMAAQAGVNAMGSKPGQDLLKRLYAATRQKPGTPAAPADPDSPMGF